MYIQYIINDNIIIIITYFMYMYNEYISEFLISSYGAPLVQRTSYLALHSSLWASGAVNYDYIVTNSINSLLIGSRCLPNATHTNHC